MSLFRRKRVADPERDLVPVTFEDVLGAFKKLGPEDAAKVRHLQMSATKEIGPGDRLWISPFHADLLGIDAKP